MRKIFLFIAGITGILAAQAQELYIFTEPASNMPSNTISAKVSASLGNRPYRLQQRYIPELMFGINKNLMVHGAASFSNMNTAQLAWEGAYVYGKYRFFSKDDVHRHFRMAVFAEGSYSRNVMNFDEISLQGDVSGVQGVLIATQLLNKLALSATTSFTRVIKTGAGYSHMKMPEKAMNYSLSAGYLVLPLEYKSYDQLNFNVYTELLAQQTLDKKTWFIDLAPAIQFIINSNSKVNLGYRFQLGGNALRSYNESFLAAFEHTFFNVWRKRKK